MDVWNVDKFDQQTEEKAEDEEEAKKALYAS